MLEVQLVEQLLPIPEIYSSNLVIVQPDLFVLH